MGNRSLMICVDNDNDVELNAYGYNGFGLMDSAFESFGGLGREVGYGYDQRGLLTSLVYPNEKVVSYQRDALGRIESVSYDGKTLVEYGYLGDSVSQKVMAGADMEYAATIDPLGRIIGETYSRISNSQTVLDFEYDYHNHSHRLIDRNGIDYGFDTLGRVVSEDSTSYTSDILGNPTNAPSSGLTYELDEEERIKQVDDAVETLGVYSYDRLGRRAMKTVGSVETHFVYDIFGNIIAEYEDGQWTRDYVYGANGEAVYMQFPQTAAMGTAFSNFVSFVEAWLCSPYCTQGDLVWDVNDDDQINLIDWSENVEYFEDAFTSNGRYLLADFRNSVVGKVNLDGSVDEILYNAWGAPSVAQGTDLEGLSILWNGYYYDYETGNYYLRNRYYSPVERRFLTDDPHGDNPDGNWNNPFFVFNQYVDGFGLQVYALGDPVNNRDDWGLWKYALPAAQRTKESQTFVEASGVWEMKHNIKGLAQLVRLNEEEFDKWGKRAIHKVNGVKKCGAWVPNTVLAYWAGEWGSLGKTWVWWTRDKNSLKSKGYLVEDKKDWTADQFENYLDNKTQSQELYGIFFWGHGYQWSSGNGLITKHSYPKGQQDLYASYYADWDLSYKLGLGMIYACYSSNARPKFSDNDPYLFLHTGVLVPIGTPPINDNIK